MGPGGSYLGDGFVSVEDPQCAAGGVTDYFDAMVPAASSLYNAPVQSLCGGWRFMSLEPRATMAGRFRTAFRDSFRILQKLMQEVLGALFLSLAVLGGADTIRQYQMYSDGVDYGLWRVLLALGFTLLTAGFGIQSFWKARKIRK